MTILRMAMSRRVIVVEIVAVIAVVFATLLFIEIYNHSKETCLECRATLFHYRVCGIPFQKTAWNDYADAVVARDPAHTHKWRSFGSTRGYALLSETFSCGRQHPIWSLPVDMQAEYSTLVSPAELESALAAIDSPDEKAAAAAARKVFEHVLDSRASRAQ